MWVAIDVVQIVIFESHLSLNIKRAFLARRTRWIQAGVRRRNEHRGRRSVRLGTRLSEGGKAVLFHRGSVLPLIVNFGGACWGRLTVEPKVGKVASVLVRRLLKREVLASQKLVTLVAEKVLVVHIGG